jgi:hypothetical protein
VEDLDRPDDRSPLGGSVKGLLANLQSIQLAYREEVTRIFSQFGTRGSAPAREKWDSYVRALRRQLNREKILVEFGVEFGEPVPEPVEELRGGASREIFQRVRPERGRPSTMGRIRNTPTRYSRC